MQLLAAVDGRGHSADVLDTATRVAGLLSMDVEAVNACTDNSVEAAQMVKEAGVTFRLLFDDAATAVLRALDDDEVGLAVVGTGQGRPVGRVARQVLTRSTKGVIVVPRHPLPWPAGEPIKMVVPLDGHVTTAKALTRHLRAFIDHDAGVIGLHVFTATNAPAYWDQFHHDYPAWQHEFMRKCCLAPAAGLRVAHGPVAAAAVDLALRERAMLIAVAWWQDLSPGHARIVTDLLLTTPVPLLLVPAAIRRRPAGVLVGGPA